MADEDRKKTEFDEAKLAEAKELDAIRKLEAEIDSRRRKLAAAKAKTSGNGKNKPLPPDDDERWVMVGDERRFVDIIIHDDYIIHCGVKYLRKDWSKASPEDWKRQWEFMRMRHAVRGPIETANVRGSEMDAFRKLLNWKG